MYHPLLETSQPSMFPQLAVAYTAWKVEDEYGRSTKLIGIFEKEADAEEAAKGQGWWAGDGNVEKRFVIKLQGGSCFLLDKYETNRMSMNVNFLDEKKKMREAALAKLSPEEKIVLGLSEEV